MSQDAKIAPIGNEDTLFIPPEDPDATCGPLVIDLSRRPGSALIYFPQQSKALLMSDEFFVKMLREIHRTLPQHVLVAVGWCPDQDWPATAAFLIECKAQMLTRIPNRKHRFKS